MSSTDQKILKLAGREFTLSYLPFAKNRVVVPAVTTALDAIKKANRTENPEALRITDMDYMYLAIYEAVSYADPSVSRETFNSWGMPLTELIAALMVVALQTGVLVQGDAKAKEA